MTLMWASDMTQSRSAAGDVQIARLLQLVERGWNAPNVQDPYAGWRYL